MQQLSRVCMIADHDFKQIEYACMFPECELSKLICSKCLKMGNHKHEQNNQSHILDNKELYEMLQEKLNKWKRDKASPLKQLIQKIQESLKNITNVIEQMEQVKYQSQNGQQLNELLLKLRNHGFNQLDDFQLNMLMNIDKQGGQIFTELSDQSNEIIQNANKIQEWCQTQQIDNIELYQKIKDANHNLVIQDQVEGGYLIFSFAISNDFKYIVSGGTEKKIKIWNHNNNTYIKSIKLDNWINHLKFSNDSKLLYVGKLKDLLQFDVNKDFKQTYKQTIHSEPIINIYCITNTIILKSSSDKTIIKTDITLNKQLLLIKAHVDRIDGLDYNHNLNIIASGSYDQSVLSNYGMDLMDKQFQRNKMLIIMINQYKYYSQQIKTNQSVLIILKKQSFGTQITKPNNCNNFTNFVMLIKFLTYHLFQINNTQPQFAKSILKYIQSKGILLGNLTMRSKSYVFIYIIIIIQSISSVMNNFIQPQSMKSLLIQGKKKLQIFKVHMD